MTRGPAEGGASPPVTLRAVLDLAWARLDTGADGRTGPLVTFATWGPEGPQMRSVMLRGADRRAAELSFYSDRFAPKIAELTADPRAGMHLWDRDTDMQIRATGLAQVRAGDDELWQAMDAGQHRNYGVTPPPGTPIPAPDAYDKPADPTAFAIVTLTLTHLDVVSLKTPHLRAGFARHDGWQGHWRAP